MLAIDKKGRKDLLGMYVSHSEWANFWLSVPTDLQNRGVRDILIACVDGLTGFPDAIHSVFPETDVQLCIVHQIRNSVKYVGSKNQKEFLADLKCVYAALTKDAAELAPDKLEEEMGRHGGASIGNRSNTNWSPCEYQLVVARIAVGVR